MNSPLLSFPFSGMPSFDMGTAGRIESCLELDALDSAATSTYTSAMPSGQQSADDSYQFTSFNGASDYALPPDTLSAALHQVQQQHEFAMMSMTEGKGSMNVKRGRGRKGTEEEGGPKNEKRYAHSPQWFSRGFGG
jgi:hypothetical protein